MNKPRIHRIQGVPVVSLASLLNILKDVILDIRSGKFKELLEDLSKLVSELEKENE